MHQLAEREIDQQNHDQEEMQAEEPVDRQHDRLKMNQAQDHGLHVHQVGPEKEPEEHPGDGDRKDKKKSEVIPQDGDVKVPLGDQAAGQQDRQGNGNQVPGVESQGLNSLPPTREQDRENTGDGGGEPARGEGGRRIPLPRESCLL